MSSIAQLPQLVALRSGGSTVAFQNTGSTFEPVTTGKSAFTMATADAVSLGSSLTPAEKLGRRFISLHGHSPENLTHLHNHAARRFIRAGGSDGQLFAEGISPRDAVTRLLSIGDNAESIANTGDANPRKEAYEGLVSSVGTQLDTNPEGLDIAALIKALANIPTVSVGSEEADNRLEHTQKYIRLGSSAFMTTDNAMNAIFGEGAGEDISYVKIYGTTTALRNYLSKIDKISGTQLVEASPATLSAMMAYMHDYISELIRNPQGFAIVPYTMREMPVPDDSPFKQISFGMNGFFLDVNHPDGMLHLNMEIKPGREEEAKEILLQLFG